MSTTHGNEGCTFLTMVRDTIAVHGLHWAVGYYARRLPQWELRFWLRVAMGV